MPPYDYDIGIIGGGSAGLTVAAGTAQLGARTLLVEKEDRLGGDCLHYGCVPSKTLIRTAQAFHTMKNARAFGLPAVALPSVDFGLVRDRIRAVIADDRFEPDFYPGPAEPVGDEQRIAVGSPPDQ